MKLCNFPGKCSTAKRLTNLGSVHYLHEGDVKNEGGNFSVARKGGICNFFVRKGGGDE